MNHISLRQDTWFGSADFTFYGGPYAHKPDGNFGVCLLEAAPIEKIADVHLPIPDFSVPDDENEVKDALKAAFRAALDGRQVYVGCMGGRGRTGLFLALLAKVALIDISNNPGFPVSFVRYQFNPNAVETEKQEAYVAGLDLSDVTAWLKWEIMKKRFTTFFRWGW